MPEQLLRECVTYFKERSVYQVLFQKIREKYYSLGYLGGSVTLTGVSLEAKQQLSGFFQKDFTENKTITISVKLMEKALSNSRFCLLEWQDILEAYYGEKFATKKEIQLQGEDERRLFFRKLLDEFQGSLGEGWLEKCLWEKGEGNRLLMQQYREHKEELAAALKPLLAGIERLPGVKQDKGGERPEGGIRIPVFAAQISGNPHFLDAGTLAERLLILFLRDYYQKPDGTKEQLLYDAGLLRDDLSNYTLTYGIEAMDLEGKVHMGIQGFLERKEPVQLTLLTVSRLGRVRPRFDKRVYIVENPAVFSALSEAEPELALVCGNGQIRMATLALLDLFEEDVEFWYAGDFDPEGLLIAQRLRKRYGRRLFFWNYRECYYRRYLSDVELDSKRKKKLEKIDEEELQEIKEAIKKAGRAAYQEMMIQEYLKDLG